MLSVLISISACILNKNNEQAQLFAVTDGQLSLGIVPSVSDSGAKIYRFLLCRNEAVSANEHFSDKNFCRPALVDDGGQEVILIPNKIRCSFATKYKGYVAATLAITLIAAGGMAEAKYIKMNTGLARADANKRGHKKIPQNG